MKFQERYFHNEYGLSCVEDYIIYILCKNTFNWSRIFYKSYFDIEEIMNYLLFEGQEYSSISFIERIQETLIQAGIINLVQLNLKEIECIDPNEFFLMELKEGVTKDWLKIDTWRSDHFVMCYRYANSKFSYVNDRPYITSDIEYNDLIEYSGREYVLKIQLINKDVGTVVDKKKIAQLEKKLKTKIELTENIYFEHEKIRDVIGIYRIVVRRMQAFWNTYAINSIFEDEIKQLDNIYLRLEYMNIRQDYDSDKISTLINKAIDIQKDVKKKALERIGGIYEYYR